MESTNWFTGPVIIALVVGIIVGFAVGTYTSPSRIESDSSIDDEATTTDSVSGSVGIDGVEVSVDDQPAGMTVDVYNLQLDKVSWVAVREYDNKTLGYTLGAHRLPAGTYATDQVDVVRPTVAGKTYAVTIFYDNGDLVFDGKTDALAAKDGQPFVVPFVVE
jgi:hypothetical protein